MPLLDSLLGLSLVDLPGERAMCKGIAICVWKDESEPEGYRVVWKKGIKSHEDLGADDFCLRFELLWTGTLMWDNPDSAGLNTLIKNGVVAPLEIPIGLPILPIEIYRAIWNAGIPLEWAFDQMQAPAPMDYVNFGDEAEFGAGAEFGDGAEFGAGAKFGKGCVVLFEGKEIPVGEYCKLTR